MPGAARLLLLGRLLTLEIGVGDGVGDARRELGILGQKADDDDARFVHREDAEPVVIGFEHALLRRHAHRVLDQAEDAENALDQRDAAERRIELAALAELQLGDHFAGEIARQDELDLAGHRFRVDHAAVDDVFVGVGPQVHIIAADDEHPRLRQIFGRDHHDHGERGQRDQDGRAQDPPFIPPQRRAERRYVEIRVDELPPQRRPMRLQRHTHFAAPADRLADRPR